MIIDNALNSLLAARDLAVKGLYGQARGVFRQFVEAIESAIVMLGDESFLAILTSGNSNQELWPKLRPKAVRKRLSIIEERLLGPELFASVQGYREGVYSWLSEATHISPVGIICGALDWPEGYESPGRCTLGGVVGRSTIGTLEQMANYLWQTLGILFRVLNTDHRWLEIAESDADLEALGLLCAIAAEGPKLIAFWESQKDDIRSSVDGADV